MILRMQEKNKESVNEFWGEMLDSFRQKKSQKDLTEDQERIFRHSKFVVETNLPHDTYEKAIELNYINIANGTPQEINIDYSKSYYYKDLFDKTIKINPGIYTLYKQMHDEIIQTDFNLKTDYCQ